MNVNWLKNSISLSRIKLCSLPNLTKKNKTRFKAKVWLLSKCLLGSPETESDVSEREYHLSLRIVSTYFCSLIEFKEKKGLIGIRLNVALSAPIPKYKTSVIRNITKHALWLISISFQHMHDKYASKKHSKRTVHLVLTFCFRVTFFNSVYVRAQFPDKLHYRTVPMVLVYGGGGAWSVQERERKWVYKKRKLKWSPKRKHSKCVYI